MTTAFWQQDSDKIILSFLGPPGLTAADVDVMATQSSLRAGLRSTGLSVCDGSLFSQIKSNTAYFGIKTYPNGTTAVVLVLEKSHPGENWPTLFAEGAPENARIFSVVLKVQSFAAYQGSDPSELSFPPEAIITVLYQDPSGWWNGFYDGNLGNLPSNFVNPLPDQSITIDVDDPNGVTYIGRNAGPAMGMGMPGMGMPMPGMGRGMGFGAGLNGELGNALKRRTQMLQGGGAPAGAHRAVPPPQQQPQEDLERQRQEQEAAAAAAAEAERQRKAAEEAERQRKAAEEAERQRKAEEERKRREVEDAEKARRAAEADALAQELARKQMEAMQAQAQAAAAIPTVNNLVPGVTTVKATSAYSGAENELSFSEGDLIKVWQIDPSGWWEGECRGSKGWFPSNFVVVVPTPTGSSSAPSSPRGSSSSGGAGGDVLEQALQSNQPHATLRHNARARGPSKRAPTMHGIPKIQTWDSTEQSPEAGAAAAAQEEAIASGAAPAHRPVGAVGIFPMPARGGALPPRGGRGGAAPARPSPPPGRGGPAARGGAAPSARGRGGLPAPRGGNVYGRGGRAASLRGDSTTTGESQQQQQVLKPLAARKPAPPRPDAAASGATAVVVAVQPAAASSVVTDASKMTPPKSWSLPVPISDFCSAAAKLMKSLPAPSGNTCSSSNLPEVKNLNTRALAVCTAEGQVFVAGDTAACSAQGAVWPLLQAMLPMNVSKGLYANQASEDNKVSSTAQNGCSVSGAIASCSALIDQHPNEQPWDRLAHICGSFSTICGCSVGFDMAAYAKSKKCSDVAWGTGYAMKGAGNFTNNIADVMDLFFQLSSMHLTLPAAARMAAVLADGANCSVGLPSREEALSHMKNYGLINGIAVYGGESGLVIAASPKIGGIAFYCPAVSSSTHIPVVAREFFKQLSEKYQL